MTADQIEKMAIEAFRMLRDELAREYDARILLIGGPFPLRLVIRSHGYPDATRPRYRIAIWFKPSGIWIIRRQVGHLAGEPKRIELAYGKTTRTGEQFGRAINDLISDERLRQMEYRKLHP